MFFGNSSQAGSISSRVNGFEVANAGGDSDLLQNFQHHVDVFSQKYFGVLSSLT